MQYVSTADTGMKTGNSGEAAGTHHTGDTPCRALGKKEKSNLCCKTCSSEGFSACSACQCRGPHLCQLPGVLSSKGSPLV